MIQVGEYGLALEDMAGILAATLQETLRLQQRLMDDVRDNGVPVADLVAQVSVLERLDDRRDQLISQLRRTASAGKRPARTSPPVREILLETLAHFRWPQNAGFLEEYYPDRDRIGEILRNRPGQPHRAVPFAAELPRSPKRGI